ncbi:MAG: hypothetical protein S0880_34430, partial [Actinomycetota bacterium]|nr:hypothetical protein [Actinomycetota bacterium]
MAVPSIVAHRAVRLCAALAVSGTLAAACSAPPDVSPPTTAAPTTTTTAAPTTTTAGDATTTTAGD